MKRIISASFAIALAIAATAFTLPKQTTDMYVFEFQPDALLGYDQSVVEDESNAHWQYVGKNQSLCIGTQTKACRVAVTEDYVDDPANPTSLLGITIDAQESSNGVAYVTDITDNFVNQISNKP